jgi:hypothetical protein
MRMSCSRYFTDLHMQPPALQLRINAISAKNRNNGNFSSGKTSHRAEQQLLKALGLSDYLIDLIVVLEEALAQSAAFARRTSALFA